MIELFEDNDRPNPIKTPHEVVKDLEYPCFDGTDLNPPLTYDNIHKSFVISYFCRRFDLSIGAEIGIDQGLNLRHLIWLNPDIKLYAIDNYEGMNDLSFIEEVIEKANGKVKFLHKKSTEACHDLPDNHLDFVFIDANHSYEATLEDIQAWRNKVHVNGLIMGHEVNLSGVARAVGESFSQFWISYDNTWIAPKCWLT